MASVCSAGLPLVIVEPLIVPLLSLIFAIYLIDGYNLLHAMGILHGRTGPTGLEKARLGLLGLLKGAYGDEASAVTVVFVGP